MVFMGEYPPLTEDEIALISQQLSTVKPSASQPEDVTECA